MQVKQPTAKPPYLITAQVLAQRVTLIAHQRGISPTDLPLNASISGWEIALTQDNFHVSDTGSLVIKLPAPRQRIKHYNVCIFGQRINVVHASDYENLRRQLCATEQRVQQLEAQYTPTQYSCMPYT